MVSEHIEHRANDDNSDVSDNGHSTNNYNSDVSDNGTCCPEDTVSMVSEPLDTDDTDAVEYVNLVDSMEDPVNPLKFLILAYLC